MENFSVEYIITISILDKVRNIEFKLKKQFFNTITGTKGNLYGNHHVLSKKYILDYFTDEIKEYTMETGTESNITGESNLVVNEFEIFTSTKGVEVYFENEENPEEFTLYPTIKVYIPENLNVIDTPVLEGNLIDDITIKWSWSDKSVAHYLVDEYKKVIAQIPIGVGSYIESGLEYGKEYTRMLVAYNNVCTSDYSTKVTIMTASQKEEYGELSNYSEIRHSGYNEDKITVESENIEVFKSGVGYGNDCLITKGYTDGVDVDSVLEFNINGYGKDKITFYPKVSFSYRHILDCNWKEYVRDGYIKYNIKAYPHEKARVRLYRYAVKELTIKYKITGRCSMVIKENGSWKSVTKTYETTGTYTLDGNTSNVSYVDRGFATMKPINKQVGSSTIVSMLESVANSDSVYANAKTKDWHDIRVYDNYNCDKGEEWRDTYGIGNDGTFRICANTNGHINSSHILKAIGHADAQLYTYELIKEGEFNMYDNNGKYTLFTESDFNNSLVCINNSSSKYDGSTIVTKVESLSKGSNITVEYSGNTVLLNIGKIYSTGDKSYTFNNDKNSLTFAYKEMFSNSLDTSYETKYRFITEITDVSPNIYYKSKRKLSTGDIISELVTANTNMQFEAKGHYVERTYHEVFPPLSEEPLHGVVNGLDDKYIRKHLGKNDLIVKAHTFPLDETYYNTIYSLELNVIQPEGATIDYVMATTNSITSKTNSDVITFSSSYSNGSTKEVDVTGIASSKLVDVHLDTDKNTRVNTSLYIDSSVLALYDKFTLSVKSKNPEVMIVSNTKNIKITDNYSNVYAVVKAIEHPSSMWSPAIHNGYYYINQHENYICAESNIISKDVIKEESIGYGTVTFSILVTTNAGNKISKSYSFRILFDMKEHQIVNDIYDLIESWLESVGLTKEDIKNIEILYNDDKYAELIYTSEVMSTDNTPDMSDIFTNWSRFSHGDPNKAYEKDAWLWNEENKKIECEINSETYIGFISKEKLEKYTAKVRFTSRCTWDNDTMGFIIAFYRDSEGNEYTLSAIRDLNNDNAQWYIQYNKGQSTQYTIKNKSEALNSVAGTIWSEYLPEGSTVFIERNKNIIKAYCSNLGSAELVEESLIEIDLTSDDRLKKFNIPCSYGLSCFSQTFSSFDNMEIINYKNVVGPISAKSTSINTVITNTDLINVKEKEIELSPLPQQFSPIMVDSEKYGLLQYVENLDGNEDKEYIEEAFNVKENINFISLRYFDIDVESVIVKINYNTYYRYKINNNVIEFDYYLSPGDRVDIKYKVNNSFRVVYDIPNDKIKLIFNTPDPIGKSLISYETSKTSNLKLLTHLSLNPIHNTSYSGFIYISDKIQDIQKIELSVSTNIMYINSNDSTRIYAKVTDKYGNPVEGEKVLITCSAGIVNLDNEYTDINGVVAATYKCPNDIKTITINASCGNKKDSAVIKTKGRVI